jgi:hypothetical protein
MAFCLRILQRAIQERTADAAAAERRLDGQRPQQQSLGVADQNRQLAHRTHQQRADPGRERQLEQMIDMLAEPVGAQHETAGPEGALMQAFDRLRVIGGLGQYGEREVAHDARDSIWRRRGPSSQSRQIPNRLSSC